MSISPTVNTLTFWLMVLMAAYKAEPEQQHQQGQHTASQNSVYPIP